MVGPGVDPNTSLIYLRAGWYDPATGQFLSVDPLVAQTQQAYQYAGDNPINETDPLGLDGILGTGIGPNIGPNILPTPGQAWSGIKSGASAAWHWTTSTAAPAVAGFVSAHYGQIGEGLAGVGCIAGLQPELCVAATVLATGASEYQNFSSRCPSAAGGLIDLLGAAPGLQVAGADFFGLLGKGKTAANVFSGIVGGAAIVGGPKLVSAAQAEEGSCGCQ